MSPNIIIDIEGVLNSNEKLVYLILCRYGNNNTVAFPSYTTIAAKGEFSRPTAIKAVKGLIEKGFITKQTIKSKTGAYSRNLYEVNYNIPGVVKEVYQGGKGDLPGVVNEVYSINNSLINNKEEEEAAASNSSLNKNSKAELDNLIGYYKDQFSLRLDREPAFKDKDAAALKKVLQQYGADDTRAMLDLFFSDDDKWYLQNGFPLTTFASQINRFLAKLAEQKPATNKNKVKSTHEHINDLLDPGNSNGDRIKLLCRYIKDDFYVNLNNTDEVTRQAIKDELEQQRVQAEQERAAAEAARAQFVAKLKECQFAAN